MNKSVQKTSKISAKLYIDGKLVNFSELKIPELSIKLNSVSFLTSTDRNKCQ